MNSVNLKNGIVTIPNKFLTLDFLLNNISPIIIPGNEYSLEITIKKIERPTGIFDKLINNNPELINLINNNKLISYGECILLDYSILISLLWINKVYFLKDLDIFIPKNIQESFITAIDIFNNSVIINKKYFLKD